jgi:hypothetical protein
MDQEVTVVLCQFCDGRQHAESLTHTTVKNRLLLHLDARVSFVFHSRKSSLLCRQNRITHPSLALVVLVVR